MSCDTKLALGLVKARLNRLASDTSLDEYLGQRIQAAVGELERTGIRLENTPDDTVLLTDYVVWQYQSRDQNTGMPEWLRLRRRERWVAQGRRDT